MQMDELIFFIRIFGEKQMQIPFKEINIFENV